MIPRRTDRRTPRRSPRRRAAVAVVGTAAAVVLTACSGSSGGDASSTLPTVSPATSATMPATASSSSSGSPTAAAGRLYVSVGDSYAAGYQPSGRTGGATTRNGFAYQVVRLAKARGYDLTLANFGCSGATTASALSRAGCGDRQLGPGATPYRKPQVAAAVDYLRAHRGQVALLTVSLGGNDVTACAAAADVNAATSCVSAALQRITANITTIVTRLRAAAGPATRIVGLTYPDVFLGGTISNDPRQRQLASVSVLAFRSLINPQLQAAYARGGASFADVTAATGAYGSQERTTTLQPYGEIPVPVARICTLTYYCQYQDIHPRTEGYRLIAELVTRTLPQR
ncbi:Lysophospholipase L1 [Jatrophihabitans endophyticus]|uniref:Lysophospholipase L1 n=1 Tax=Jatrophihabitans endophyticus TaxID=1206085 RepID=A0A1M5KLN2_9ACTN|nr:GDSL-type esterase/lipase family protein [Jatrophihabitans endophyticus]SHG53656.1 Lysophospholipase L1 [Jatrophihabitans endophyticus]